MQIVILGSLIMVSDACLDMLDGYYKNHSQKLEISPSICGKEADNHLSLLYMDICWFSLM
jgi:hypothetical protein